MEKKRDVAIDDLKGLLVSVMVFAHVVQFFPRGIETWILGEYANLTTFSGFVFSFGYVSYYAYIKKKSKLKKRLIKNILKTYIAFCISGTGYCFLVEGGTIKETIIQVLTLKKVPGYSEFLLSFVLLYVEVYLISIVKKDDKFFYIIGIIVSLCSTFINYTYVHSNLIGSIIGTTNYTCFPIVQYTVYLLMGMYLAEKQIIFDKKVIGLSIVGTGIFCIYCLINRELPTRFPPSVYWILGGGLFIYMYYLLMKSKYGVIFKKIQLIRLMGANSLVFLVVSNLVIFSGKKVLGEWYWATYHLKEDVIYIWIIVFCTSISMSYAVTWIINRLKHIE